MGKPHIKLVKDGPRELGFREMAWNFSVNSLAFLATVLVLPLEGLIILPLGIVYGLLVNQYPDWAKLTLTQHILSKLPTKNDPNQREAFSSRPFYRKK